MPDASDQLADALQSVYRTLTEATRRQDRVHEIPLMAVLVLGTISKEPGITVSELARRLGIAKSHASELVEGLSQKELLRKEPDPEDRRLLRLVLSELGRQKIDEGHACARRRFRELTTDLPEELALRLARDLSTLQAAIVRRSRDEA